MPKRTNSACSRPGNQPQHARLIAPLDLRLEPDEAEVIAGQVVLPQLHGGVRPRPVRGSVRPTGFIGPKRSVSGPRCAITSIGRQPSKKSLLVEVVDRRRFRVDERVVERARTRPSSAGSSDSRPAPSSTPHACGASGTAAPPASVAECRPKACRHGRRPWRPCPIATLPKHLRAIDRVGEHDRADRVVEIKVLRARRTRDDVRRQRVGCQRTGRDDHRVALVRLGNRP